MRWMSMLAGLCGLAAAAGPCVGAPLTQAQVTRIVNDVRVSAGGDQTRPVVLNETVGGEASVVTGVKSRAELKFTDGTLTRLGANTVFTFTKGTRDMQLQQGTMLLQVPKNAGGAKITTAAVTAAITGTTIMLEFSPADVQKIIQSGARTLKEAIQVAQSFIKIIVIEGTLRAYMNNRTGESILVGPGQMLAMKPGERRLPEPVDVDIKTILKTSKLYNMGEGEGGGMDFTQILAAMNEQEQLKDNGTLQDTPLFMQSGLQVLLDLPDNLTDKMTESLPYGGDPMQEILDALGLSDLFPSDPGPDPEPEPEDPGNSPVKYGPATNIPSMVVFSNTYIQTDPFIAQGGVTNPGSIYNATRSGQTPGEYLFGTPDPVLDSSGPVGDVTVFLFDPPGVTFSGNPIIDLGSGGPDQVVFASLGGIAFNPGTYDFAPLSMAGFVTENAGINIGPGVVFHGPADLAFYARGSGSDMVFNGQYLNAAGGLSLAAGQDVFFGGHSDGADLDLFAMRDVIWIGTAPGSDVHIEAGRIVWGMADLVSGGGSIRSGFNVDFSGRKLSTEIVQASNNISAETIQARFVDAGGSVNAWTAEIGNGGSLLAGGDVSVGVISNSAAGGPTLVRGSNVVAGVLQAATGSMQVRGQRRIQFTTALGSVTVNAPDIEALGGLNGGVVDFFGPATVTNVAVSWGDLALGAGTFGTSNTVVTVSGNNVQGNTASGISAKSLAVDGDVNGVNAITVAESLMIGGNWQGAGNFGPDFFLNLGGGPGPFQIGGLVDLRTPSSARSLFANAAGGVVFGDFGIGGSGLDLSGAVATGIGATGGNGGGLHATAAGDVLFDGVFVNGKGGDYDGDVLSSPSGFGGAGGVLEAVAGGAVRFLDSFLGFQGGNVFGGSVTNSTAGAGGTISVQGASVWVEESSYGNEFDVSGGFVDSEFGTQGRGGDGGSFLAETPGTIGVTNAGFYASGGHGNGKRGGKGGVIRGNAGGETILSVVNLDASAGSGDNEPGAKGGTIEFLSGQSVRIDNVSAFAGGGFVVSSGPNAGAGGTVRFHSASGMVEVTGYGLDHHGGRPRLSADGGAGAYFGSGDGGAGGLLELIGQTGVSVQQMELFADGGDGGGAGGAGGHGGTNRLFAADGQVFLEYVQTSADGGDGRGGGDGGDGGLVHVSAGGAYGYVTILNSSLGAKGGDSEGGRSGDGGTITVLGTRDVSLVQSDLIADSDPLPSVEGGTGGTITVTADGNVLLDDALLSADGGDADDWGAGARGGNGGSVLVDAASNLVALGGSLEIRARGGEVAHTSTNSLSGGHGGQITLRAGGDVDFAIGQNVYAEGGAGMSGGNGGVIDIGAEGSVMLGSGFLVADGGGGKLFGGAGGQVTVSATQDILAVGTVVSAGGGNVNEDVSGPSGGAAGQGGAVSLVAGGQVLLDGVSFNNEGGDYTGFAGPGDGGDGGTLFVNAGGPVTIRHGAFYMNGGNIVYGITNSLPGKGGVVTLNGDSVLVESSTFQVEGGDQWSGTQDSGGAGGVFTARTPGSAVFYNATIHADGGMADDAPGVGGDAGEINIFAGGDVTVMGGYWDSLTAWGGAAPGNGTGGAGGAITIHASNGIVRVAGSGPGGINAQGGSTDSGTGGSGGDVTVFGQSGVQVDSTQVFADGGGIYGYFSGVSGGDGGSVSVTTGNGSAVFSNVTLGASGGSAYMVGDGGDGGEVIVTAGGTGSVILANTTLAADGGNGGYVGSGGEAGEVAVLAGGDVTVTGNSDLRARGGWGEAGGDGNDVVVRAGGNILFDSLAKADATGGSSYALTNAVAGAGGDIEVEAAGNVTASNATFLARGGDTPSGDNGGDGGDIDVTAVGGTVSLVGSALDTRNGDQLAFGSGVGGNVAITSSNALPAGYGVLISSTVIRTGDDGSTANSAAAGDITVRSEATSGMGIRIDNSSQLLALAQNPGLHKILLESKGGAIHVFDSTLDAKNGKVEVRNPGLIVLDNANLRADTIKALVLSGDGWLRIRGGTINANSSMFLYGGLASGGVEFLENTSLTGSSMKYIAGDTVRILNGKIVNVSGPAAQVFANNDEYNRGGFGNFTGSGAVDAGNAGDAPTP